MTAQGSVPNISTASYSARTEFAVSVCVSTKTGLGKYIVQFGSISASSGTIDVSLLLKCSMASSIAAEYENESLLADCAEKKLY